MKHAAARFILTAAIGACSLGSLPAYAAGAATWSLYAPGHAYEGRLVEIPGGRTIERYGPAGQPEGRYQRTPNGWRAYGPGNRYEGQLQLQGGAARHGVLPSAKP